MGMFSASSDLDYHEECHGERGGIERTCACGRTVFIGRDEPYVLTVTCERCQSRPCPASGCGKPATRIDLTESGLAVYRCEQLHVTTLVVRT